ncbi:cob(I)yrinic acid a,c-diamide adenosyltransferase [Candidatus Gracilibacteria bacterium]|nr:cob(I)yrinic acid a,c-diamide adenosyltransferase [Candidatus Gracilibacteria bacterium]
MKIYTKRGDKGETDLFGGKRVPKDTLRIEAIGTVDELNSLIGVVLAVGPEKNISDLLVEIQKDLFVLGADLATPEKQSVRGHDDVPRVSDVRIEFFEQMMDELDNELEPMTAFILPSGCQTGAWLHVCRSVCRRAERICVSLMNEEPSVEMSVKFLNRLSDLFFVLARYENLKKGIGETKWMV